MAETSEKIASELKAAMKNRDDLKKNVLKLLKSVLDKERIDSKKDLSAEQEIKLVMSQHKQRIETAELYKKSGDDERAKAELVEADIIATFLPKQLDEVEIDKHIETAFSQTGASTPADIGKVMGILSGKLAGVADMKLVSEKVRSRLSS